MRISAERHGHLAGKFVQMRRDSVELSEPGSGVLIMAGPWPCRTVGARQMRCFFCDLFCGLSPEGQRVAQDPTNAIACPECSGQIADMSDWLDSLPGEADIVLSKLGWELVRAMLIAWCLDYRSRVRDLAVGGAA